MVENNKDDTEMVVLPIYDISKDEWTIQLEYDSFKQITYFKQITNEEYKKLYVFKTRYDVEKK